MNEVTDVLSIVGSMINIVVMKKRVNRRNPSLLNLQSLEDVSCKANALSPFRHEY